MLTLNGRRQRTTHFIHPFWPIIAGRRERGVPIAKFHSLQTHGLYDGFVWAHTQFPEKLLNYFILSVDEEGEWQGPI